MFTDAEDPALVGCFFDEFTPNGNSEQFFEDLDGWLDRGGMSLDEWMRAGEAHAYLLGAPSHPELDFSKDGSADGLLDFTVAPGGNLLLLTSPATVWEYTPEGVLVGQTEYDIAALSFTCGEDGVLYFADAEDNRIVKADESGVLHPSRLGEGLPTLAEVSALYAAGEDRVALVRVDENNNLCTYTIDVSGEEAVCVAHTTEQVFGGIRVALTTEGQGTRVMRVRYADGGVAVYSFRGRENRAIAGVEVYGVIGGETLIGSVRERADNEEGFVETTVRIERGVGITAVNRTDRIDGALIRTCDGVIYVLKRQENAVRVAPLSVLCGEMTWENERWGELIWESARDE